MVQPTASHRQDPIHDLFLAVRNVPLEPIQEQVLHAVGEAQGNAACLLGAPVRRGGEDGRNLMVVEPRDQRCQEDRDRHAGSG